MSCRGDDNKLVKAKEIDVCRYAAGTDSDEREMAVTVADDFSYQAIATLLINALSDHARNNKVKTLFSIDLSNNNLMRKLGVLFGMTAEHDPSDAKQVIYTLAL